MNPIIFLDIDGVLNPDFQYHYDLDDSLQDKLAKKFNNPNIQTMNIYFLNQFYFGFNKNSCDYIKSLVIEFDAKIVLTSSWRLSHTKDDISIMFTILGIENAFIDFIDIGTPRDKMIKKYIKEHHVSKYIIIDDSNMTNQFGYRFILTSNTFNETDFQKARYALRLQTS